jgi:hypothetical protein
MAVHVCLAMGLAASGAVSHDVLLVHPAVACFYTALQHRTPPTCGSGCGQCGSTKVQRLVWLHLQVEACVYRDLCSRRVFERIQAIDQTSRGQLDCMFRSDLCAECEIVPKVSRRAAYQSQERIVDTVLRDEGEHLDEFLDCEADYLALSRDVSAN